MVNNNGTARRRWKTRDEAPKDMPRWENHDGVSDTYYALRLANDESLSSVLFSVREEALMTFISRVSAHLDVMDKMPGSFEAEDIHDIMETEYQELFTT